MPYGESRRLLDELLALTTAEDGVYRHVWKQWDLVMWDNRTVLHRGRPWDSARYPRDHAARPPWPARAPPRIPVRGSRLLPALETA